VDFRILTAQKEKRFVAAYILTTKIIVFWIRESTLSKKEYLELKYEPKKKYSPSYDLNCSKSFMHASTPNCSQYSLAVCIQRCL
jgi:hypothetical protein